VGAQQQPTGKRALDGDQQVVPIDPDREVAGVGWFDPPCQAVLAVSLGARDSPDCLSLTRGEIVMVAYQLEAGIGGISTLHQPTHVVCSAGD
jgi:hypothetical protein